MFLRKSVFCFPSIVAFTLLGNSLSVSAQAVDNLVPTESVPQLTAEVEHQNLSPDSSIQFQISTTIP